MVKTVGVRPRSRRGMSAGLPVVAMDHVDRPGEQRDGGRHGVAEEAETAGIVLVGAARRAVKVVPVEGGVVPHQQRLDPGGEPGRVDGHPPRVRSHPHGHEGDQGLAGQRRAEDGTVEGKGHEHPGAQCCQAGRQGADDVGQAARLDHRHGLAGGHEDGRCPVPLRHPAAFRRSAVKASSSMIRRPSFLARSSLLPASAPATT